MPTHHYPLERLRWPCGFVVRPVGPAWSDLRRAVQGGKSLTPVKWIPQSALIAPGGISRAKLVTQPAAFEAPLPPRGRQIEIRRGTG